MTTDNTLAAELERLLADVTDGDLSTAEHSESGGSVECPMCGGHGEVEQDGHYNNFDGVALGVQFYGIGKHFGAHETLWRWFTANRQAILTALRTTQTDSAAVAREGVDADLAACERAIERMGWAEIEAFMAEPGQSPYEDAGGFLLRKIKTLFGIKPDRLETYREAATRLVAEARAQKGGSHKDQILRQPEPDNTLAGELEAMLSEWKDSRPMHPEKIARLVYHNRDRILSALRQPEPDNARLLRALEALDKAVDFRAYHHADPMGIRFGFANEADRLAAANALDDSFSALASTDSDGGE